MRKDDEKTSPATPSSLKLGLLKCIYTFLFTRTRMHFMQQNVYIHFLSRTRNCVFINTYTKHLYNQSKDSHYLCFNDQVEKTVYSNLFQESARPFVEFCFCNRFKEYQVPGSVLSQSEPSLLRKLDLNQWLNATVHFDVVIPINFDNSSSHWTRTLRVAQVDWLGASVHYKSVDFMVLSFTWLFLRLLASGTVQFSSSIFQFDFICLSFRSVVTFVSTAVCHSHSYIRCTCSSSFSAAFVLFTIYCWCSLMRSPYFDFTSFVFYTAVRGHILL